MVVWAEMSDKLLKPSLFTVLVSKLWAFMAVASSAYLLSVVGSWDLSAWFVLVPLIAYWDGRLDGKRYALNRWGAGKRDDD